MVFLHLRITITSSSESVKQTYICPCSSCYPVLHPAAVSLTSELDHSHPPGVLSPLLDFVLSHWSVSLLYSGASLFQPHLGPVCMARSHRNLTIIIIDDHSVPKPIACFSEVAAISEAWISDVLLYFQTLSLIHAGTQSSRCWGSKLPKSCSTEVSGRRSTPPSLPPPPPPPPPHSPSPTCSPSPCSWMPASLVSPPSPTASELLEGCGLQRLKPRPLTLGLTSSNTSTMRSVAHYIIITS